MTLTTNTVVIGGGATGVGVMMGLAELGIPCTLVERGAICEQTSAASSKMLHGGIRYLENGDIELVQEALLERNYWAKRSPHLVTMHDFCIPVYKAQRYPKWMLRLGVGIYDVLSGPRPPYSYSLSKSETLQRFPSLNPEGLTGSVCYQDAVVDDKALVVECLNEIRELSHVCVYEHTEVTKIHREGTRWQVQAGDSSLKASHVVICAGPFTDLFMKSMNLPWTPQILPSKGVHIWLGEDTLKLAHPCVLTPPDGRVIFAIPYPGKILIGTTEKVLDRAEFSPNPSHEEINYLIANVKEFFDLPDLSEEDVIESYAGIRPLVCDGSHNSGKVSRTHKTTMVRDGIWAITGGKYTTFRIMGEEVVRAIHHRISCQ